VVLPGTSKPQSARSAESKGDRIAYSDIVKGSVSTGDLCWEMVVCGLLQEKGD
jgi:hypothetical protein